MASLKDRRHTDRLRQQRWRQRQHAQGKKQVSVMLSLKAQILLNREKRRSGKSTAEIIEHALLSFAAQCVDQLGHAADERNHQTLMDS